MVAVGAVFGLKLPVAVIRVAGGTAQDFQAVGGLVHDHVDDLGGFAEVLFEWLHIRIDAAEEEPAVAFEPCHLREVVRTLLVELLRIAGLAGVLDLEQLAGVVEGPAVEGAGERGAVVRLAPAQHRPAVAAGVDEGVQSTLLVTRDDDRLAADVGGEVVAHVGDLAVVGQVHPVALEDVLHFQFEQVLVREDAPFGAVNAVLVILHEGLVKVGSDARQRLCHVGSYQCRAALPVCRDLGPCGPPNVRSVNRMQPTLPAGGARHTRHLPRPA